MTKESVKSDSVVRAYSQPGLFVSIDFDGTVTDLDITDAVIKEFASIQWEDIEYQWEKGVIGSRQCLSRQMALINSPLPEILSYVHTFSVNKSFPDFVEFLRAFNIAFSIVSDGFQPFIEVLLAKAGLKDVPVYANQLIESANGLKAIFPYSSDRCSSGVCKCAITERLIGAASLIAGAAAPYGRWGNNLPVIHIGDGRSDFCLAHRAAYVFARGKLAQYCKLNLIPHCAFTDLAAVRSSFDPSTIETHLKTFIENRYLTWTQPPYTPQILERN
ncbi:MAG: MtnX-like HAD-IB family phosphatase [Nitrospirae bacterium]|nr:MtnX-like HAD-IB family phosphatase [Nitrospirota bacterium]